MLQQLVPPVARAQRRRRARVHKQEVVWRAAFRVVVAAIIFAAIVPITTDTTVATAELPAPQGQVQVQEQAPEQAQEQVREQFQQQAQEQKQAQEQFQEQEQEQKQAQEQVKEQDQDEQKQCDGSPTEPLHCQVTRAVYIQLKLGHLDLQNWIINDDALKKSNEFYDPDDDQALHSAVFGLSRLGVSFTGWQVKSCNALSGVDSGIQTRLVTAACIDPVDASGVRRGIHPEDLSRAVTKFAYVDTMRLLPVPFSTSCCDDRGTAVGGLSCGTREAATRFVNGAFFASSEIWSTGIVVYVLSHQSVLAPDGAAFRVYAGPALARSNQLPILIVPEARAAAGLTGTATVAGVQGTWNYFTRIAEQMVQLARDEAAGGDGFTRNCWVTSWRAWWAPGLWASSAGC